MKKTKATTSTAMKAHLPMRGGLVGILVKFLRLSDGVREVVGDLSPATVKRVLTDDPKVADATRATLIRKLGKAVFPSPYLAARGLSPEEVREHDEDVSIALDAILHGWDQHVTSTNEWGPLPARVVGSWMIHTGYTLEVAARAAAYATLYGRLHGAFDLIPTWWTGEGLTVWYRTIFQRGGHMLKLDPLAKAAGVERNTVKRIKNGSHIPQNETIQHLAAALAQYGIIDAVRKHRQSCDEIEFELRVACAVAQIRPLIKQGDWPGDALLRQLFFLRSRFRTVERAQVRDILLKGVASRYFEPFEMEVKEATVGELLRLVQPMVARAQYVQRLSEKDPRAALRAMADDFAWMAADMRAAATEIPSVHTRIFAEFWEDSARMWKAIGEGKTPPDPSYNSDELRASVHIMKTMAPPHWDGAVSSTAEKEKILREAVTTCPNMAEATTALGMLLWEGGRREEAVACFRDGVRRNPDADDAREVLGRALYDMADFQGVLDVLGGAEGGAEGQPGPVRAFRGFALLRLGKVGEAEAAFREVLAEHPHLPLVHEGLAACERARGGRDGRAREHDAAAMFYATGRRPT